MTACLVRQVLGRFWRGEGGNCCWPMCRIWPPVSLPTCAACLSLCCKPWHTRLLWSFVRSRSGPVPRIPAGSTVGLGHQVSCFRCCSSNRGTQQCSIAGTLTIQARAWIVCGGLNGIEQVGLLVLRRDAWCRAADSGPLDMLGMRGQAGLEVQYGTIQSRTFSSVVYVCVYVKRRRCAACAWFWVPCVRCSFAPGQMPI